MTTINPSGVYTFAVTRDDIIRQSLLNIGKFDPYEGPTAMQTQDCTIVLNMMCKQWMGNTNFAPGLKVWTRQRGYMFLSTSNTQNYLLGPDSTMGWTLNPTLTTTTAAAVSTATSLTIASASGVATGQYIGIQQTDGSLYWTTISLLSGTTVTLTAGLPVGCASGAVVYTFTTIAQQPLFIESALLRDSFYNDTPLNILRTTQDYDVLSGKAQLQNQADPTAIYFETQLNDSNLWLDCGVAQDVTKYLVLTCQFPVQDFVNPTDNPYYPQEWWLALAWGLTKLICPQYNRPWTALMEDNFKTAFANAGQKDGEVTSLYFQPGLDP